MCCFKVNRQERFGTTGSLSFGERRLTRKSCPFHGLMFAWSLVILKWLWRRLLSQLLGWFLEPAPGSCVQGAQNFPSEIPAQSFLHQEPQMPPFLMGWNPMDIFKNKTGALGRNRGYGPLRSENGPLRMGTAH